MATLYQDQRVVAAMAAALAAQRSMGGSENTAEMRHYLDKLKDLVPMCPKNRKVSKLELIQHVIDYIGDLQDTLQSDSDSDSPPDSPMERMSFSDAYNSRVPQQSGHRITTGNSASSSSSDGVSDMECSTSYTSDCTPQGYTSGYSSQDYSNGYTSNFSGSSEFSGSSSNYSTILYSDHGTSPPPHSS